MKDINLKEKTVLNSIRSKLNGAHFKKVIKDDLEDLRSEGTKSLFLRWFKRAKRIFLLPILVLSVFKQRFPAPLILRRILLVRRIKRIEGRFEKIETIEANVGKLDGGLSIVINTKNSPPFFKEILQKYKNQIGFKKIEIIIVDSGSEDGTLQVAKQFDSKIIKIKPEEFRHGRSRNIGIEVASGKYIINAVSDAIPTTLDLAYKVAIKLEEEQAGAISVRQIPRSDADLFAVWSVWQHYQFIFGDSRKNIWISGVRNYESLAPIRRRKLAILDDVFVLHRGETIKKEKYDNYIRYAEDLLLSINYIKKGIKIGVLQSESVIHSHSRPPEYYIKRYFVDANLIYEVFGIIPNSMNKEYVSEEKDQIYVDMFSIIKSAEDKLFKLGNQETGWLEKYLQFYRGNNHIVNKKISRIWNRLYDEIYEEFEGFLVQTGEDLDGHVGVKSRVATMTSGILLSEYFLKSTKGKKATTFFKDFKELLEKEI